jgi:DNA-binding CsgD family transcriptional regulator
MAEVPRQFVPIANIRKLTQVKMVNSGSGMIDAQRQLQDLTEKQKACLRLVSENYSSKEIGRRLGITHHTVDQRLRTATNNLGVDSRFEAARLLAAFEKHEQPMSEAYVYQPPHVPMTDENVSQEWSGTQRDLKSDAHVRHFQDAATPSWPPQTQSATWAFPSISEPGGFWKPRTLSQKLVMAIVIMLLSLIAFGAGVTALEVLSRLD